MYSKVCVNESEKLFLLHQSNRRISLKNLIPQMDQDAVEKR